MCLGIPGRVIDIVEQNGIMMGRIDFGGVVKEACLAMTPEATVGDYVIVHAGFAISRLDEAAAEETLALLRAIDAQAAAEDEPQP